MRKIIKKYRLAIFILISLVLILFWFFTSLVTINKVSFSIVTLKTQNNFLYNTDFNLSNGKQFRGKFTAKENNLGLIIVWLSEFKASDDKQKVIFKLKNSRDKNWSFVQEFDSKLFDSQKIFPFGFPPITNSKNNEYEFQISQGVGRRYLHIENPNKFQTGYKYSVVELKKGKNLISFLYLKSLSSFTDVEFVAKSIIYLVPLFIFVILFVSFEKIYSLSKILRFALPISLVLIVVFSSTLGKSLFYLFIFTWLLTVFTFKLKSALSFALCLSGIFIWILLMPFANLALQNTLNIVVYSLLLVGVGKLIIEEKSRK